MAAKKKSKKSKTESKKGSDVNQMPEGIAEAPTDEGEVLQTRKEELFVRLEDQDILDRGRKMASVAQDIVTEKEAHKAKAKERRDRIAKMEEERDKLAGVVSTGLELTEVDVRVVAYFERNEAVTIRLDTGRVIEKRTLTAEERQMMMEAAE